jgi:hypothetical protein
MEVEARRQDQHVGALTVMIGHNRDAGFRRKRTQSLGEAKVAVHDDEELETLASASYAPCTARSTLWTPTPEPRRRVREQTGSRPPIRSPRRGRGAEASRTPAASERAKR